MFLQQLGAWQMLAGRGRCFPRASALDDSPRCPRALPAASWRSGGRDDQVVVVDNLLLPTYPARAVTPCCRCAGPQRARRICPSC